MEFFFFNLSQGVETIAGQIDAVTLSCLETGAFQLKLQKKSAYLSIASRPTPPEDERGGKPSISGDFFPQGRDVRRSGARASACAAKAVLLPARSEFVYLFGRRTEPDLNTERASERVILTSQARLAPYPSLVALL